MARWSGSKTTSTRPPTDPLATHGQADVVRVDVAGSLLQPVRSPRVRRYRYHGREVRCPLRDWGNGCRVRRGGNCKYRAQPLGIVVRLAAGRQGQEAGDQDHPWLHSADFAQNCRSFRRILSHRADLPCVPIRFGLRSRSLGSLFEVTFGLHWVRRRQRDLARVVLALFCLAWLQASAVPCAMAGERQPAANQVSIGAGAAGHHCQYCPPPQGTPAGDDQPGACAYPHQAQVDVRAAAGWMIAAPAVAAFTSFEVRPIMAVVLPPAVAHPQRLPFSVSYCRFIE
jgi:hypothetical protein